MSDFMGCVVNRLHLCVTSGGEHIYLFFNFFHCLQAEKNRAAASANNLQKGSTGPMRLYVGSLHFNITEDMLRGIFEPFGRVYLRFDPLILISHGELHSLSHINCPLAFLPTLACITETCSSTHN